MTVAVSVRSSLLEVTVRAPTPMVQGLRSTAVLYLAGTLDRPRINIRDWDVDILPGVPEGPPEGLDAENGDNLLTELGERMTTEYS